jgi:hypothetical protein
LPSSLEEALYLGQAGDKSACRNLPQKQNTLRHPNHAKKWVWLKCLLSEFGELDNQPVKILCDNQSAIKSIHNPKFHQRTKHIDVRYHFIRQLQEDGIIDATYVPSKEQKADIFTKPLPKLDFERMRKKLGVDGPLAKK